MPASEHGRLPPSPIRRSAVHLQHHRRIYHACCRTSALLPHVVKHPRLSHRHIHSLGVVLPSLSPVTSRKQGHWPTMTTPSLDQPSTTAQNIPQSSAAVSQTEPDHNALSTSAVEMKTLQSAAGAPAALNTTTHDSGTPQIAPINFTNAADVSPPESTQPLPSSTAAPAARTELSRTETEVALGPSTDGPAANPDNSNGPTVVIMLLLTTGARHPYKIDERYLKKRNVTVEEMDPYNISVYTLKELIWRDWREGTS